MKLTVFSIAKQTYDLDDEISEEILEALSNNKRVVLDNLLAVYMDETPEYVAIIDERIMYGISGSNPEVAYEIALEFSSLFEESE